MEKKQELAKIALAALLATVSLPVSGQANDINEEQGIFLAAGCAHCGGSKIADNTTDRNYYNAKNNSYQTSSNTYNNTKDSTTDSTTDSTGGYYQAGSKNGSTTGTRQSGTSNYSTGAATGYGGTNTYGATTDSYSNTSNWNDSRRLSSDNSPYTGSTNNNNLRDSSYYSSYNTNRTGSTSPTYVDSYRSTSYEYEVSPYAREGGYGVNTSVNRDYNTVNDYDYNRAAVQTSTSSATLTEAQLLGMLSPQARAIYLSLDAESKALAIQLASQDSYQDKDQAVREAQRRMNERRGIMSR